MIAAAWPHVGAVAVFYPLYYKCKKGKPVVARETYLDIIGLEPVRFSNSGTVRSHIKWTLRCASIMTQACVRHVLTACLHAFGRRGET